MSEQCERMDGAQPIVVNKMASLKVYKAFRDFRTYAYLCIDKMPRWVKNSEGKECIRDIKECVMCLSVLCRSRDDAEKIRAVNTALMHLDCVCDSLDFFTEPQVNALSSRQLAHLFRLMDDVEGQLLRLRSHFAADGSQKD